MSRASRGREFLTWSCRSRESGAGGEDGGWKMEDGEGKSPGDAMSELPSSILHSPSSLAAQRLPAPRCGAISVRVATMADFAFMDELQRLHQKMLGFLPRGTIHGKLAAGHVLIAETTNEP